MRLGLIGPGRIGAFHAQTPHDLDRVDPLVVTDADPGVTATVAERVGAEAVDAGPAAFCENPSAADVADAVEVAGKIAGART